jgi:hypothetical protein
MHFYAFPMHWVSVSLIILNRYSGIGFHCARVCVPLSRPADRDGHAMSTFELPSMKASMLVEDSDEHREFFGAEGEAVLHFRSFATC